METLKNVLARGCVLVSDGGIGTELQKRGLVPGSCGDEWNLTHPDLVADVHRAYLDAGAKLITTNTFGSNRFNLANYDLADKQHEITFAGARIARQAAGTTAYVMGSVGPCGGFLEPLGEISRGDLETSLRAQITALIAGGVDAIMLETFSALDEIEISVRVARELSAPFIVLSCCYDPTHTGPRTFAGATPEQVRQTAARAGADALGANCGTITDPADFRAIAESYRLATDCVVIQPNAGTPEFEGDTIVYRVSAEDYAQRVSGFAGFANVLGGCCGTNPVHIRALAAACKPRPGCEIN